MTSKPVRNFIKIILEKNFGTNWENGWYKKSSLLQYLNLKTGAIDGNSKTRRSFANIYSIKGILHFYILDGFEGRREKYSDFEGFEYTKLFQYMRSLYGGEKLQNHALNSRTNGEFSNKITHNEKLLIVQNSGKYLINPDYLYINDTDIASVVVEIIDQYVELLREKDGSLLSTLSKLNSDGNPDSQKSILGALLKEDAEARIFEIISFAILRSHYSDTAVYIGFSREEIHKQFLQLFKTGRTNANDGGIDFVMRPLGRFFQVTEVDNYDKYFLDIDKILKYPITFVVKTNLSKEIIFRELMKYADDRSGGLKVLKKKYENSIEEVITINELSRWLNDLSEQKLVEVIEDITTYYKLELNLN